MEGMGIYNTYEICAIFCSPWQHVAEGGYWITLRPSVCPSVLE